MNRREFLGAAAAATATAQSSQPILDIHQHTDYSGRPDDVMVKHQDTMGIAKTILLPAGKMYGLEAGASGNDRVWEIVRKYPGKYICFANEVPSEPDARPVIEKYLKSVGRPVQVFCGIELRVPAALTFGQWSSFNVPYLKQLREWGLIFGDQSGVCRSNIELKSMIRAAIVHKNQGFS